MRILFITAGLTPLRGQANSYQEALMEKFVARGHEVSCLCVAETSGRPTVHWTKETAGAFPVYRVFNGGVYPANYSQGGVGTRRPDRDVHAPAALRRAVLAIVRAAAPEVISLQTFFGFPFSLVPEIRRLGPAVVFTMHDFFALCPTAHLQCAGTRCRLPAEALVCHDCTAAAPAYPAFWLTRQLNRAIDRRPEQSALRRGLCRVRNGLQRANRAWNRLQPDRGNFPPRRHASIRALRELTVVHCISQREAAVVRELAGDLPNVKVLPLHPPSAGPAPDAKSVPAENRPVRFVALNVHAPYKGSELLARIARQLVAAGVPHELHFHGLAAEPRLELPGVHYHGRYRAEDLDRIAAAADFCLVPSLCDETLGFVGLEMMRRGVPLVVSAWAGVSEFVEPGVTGFVFDPDQDNGLFEILARLAREPDLRRSMPANLRQRQAALKSFDDHAQDMEQLFARALQR